ncbi:uncharacterized protein LOC129320399 isoform X2 [Prosopis cineraria]|uniref:uncharacterized protein LOC129320399 isoform X2 n=1 Tax=Prosopis cineraria TaxID=364024 RepID=UPI00240EAFFA|nr:uncharacterized protein LOC129320399 isoform X2 [Prosopis cineraria]
METRQKAIYLDRIKRRCGMTHSWYVDPIGLSGGLALWWKNDIDIHVIFSCKNYIHIAAASNSWILNFQKFAADCDLLDLEAKGSRFTWCNQRSNEECIKEKIDRAMANNHFRDAFPKALAFHIDAVASDHHFLLVNLCFIDSKTPFKFRYEINWASHPDFKNVVKRSWYFADPEAYAVVPQFISCSERCSKELTVWSKKAFPNNRKAINDLLKQIEAYEDGALTEDSILTIKALTHKLENFWRKEETYWWQRSRVNWIASGNLNTKFFHASTVLRRQRN